MIIIFARKIWKNCFGSDKVGKNGVFQGFSRISDFQRVFLIFPDFPQIYHRLIRKLDTICYRRKLLRNFIMIKKKWQFFFSVARIWTNPLRSGDFTKTLFQDLKIWEEWVFSKFSWFFAKKSPWTILGTNFEGSGTEILKISSSEISVPEI